MRALFNTGPTHSFIALHTVDYIPHSQISLLDHFIVFTPRDQIIVAKRNVEIHDKKLLRDLEILDARDS